MQSAHSVKVVTPRDATWEERNTRALKIETAVHEHHWPVEAVIKQVLDTVSYNLTAVCTLTVRVPLRLNQRKIDIKTAPKIKSITIKYKRLLV